VTPFDLALDAARMARFSAYALEARAGKETDWFSFTFGGYVARQVADHWASYALSIRGAKPLEA
jgi:alpha/beta superfamily hydrolase